MKIIQITASLKSTLGGPPKVVFAIHQKLKEYSDFTTLVFGENHLLKSNVITGKAIFGNRYGLVISPFLKISRDQILQSNIVLVHGYYLFSTLIAIFNNPNRTTFIMPHGSLEIYQEKKRRLRKVFYNQIVKILSRQKTIHWLVASESEKYSVKVKFPDAIIDVVGLGINVQDISIYRNSQDRADGINLFTYSRIAEKKRIDVCIHLVSLLIKRFPETHLDIVGEGKQQLVDVLKKQTESLNLSPNVTFHGHVERISQINFKFNSPIFLLTSENENFAIAVCEAIASGIPVIVNKEVAMHNFVKLHNVGVVVDQISVPEITSAVEAVMKNYENLRKNCLASAHLLDWNQVIFAWNKALSI
jgi:glycosyltransferase involved in cell wall biosynthesis